MLKRKSTNPNNSNYRCSNQSKKEKLKGNLKKIHGNEQKLKNKDIPNQSQIIDSHLTEKTT